MRLRQIAVRSGVALLVIVCIVASFFGALHLWLSYKYPYGRSHCCDSAVTLSLLHYANEHGGEFPAGEATPEASLSLLYPKHLGAEILRGKTVPVETVENILGNGGRLGPETCGWQYVEGLRIEDSSRFAILWDKAGLDHNGGRQNGYTVSFIFCERKFIPYSDWNSFLKEQRRLWAELKPGQKIPAVLETTDGTATEK